ncbi:uncharacterized protein LOC111498054 [Cucurbita maxima]|uniref:Uncharacterized protein LOC111498054 n=1 Tax=Cucurbita maxima TaxID=3661 RepID=A0A6J1KVT9_CUCMA|nr:uncharacterized protein LOC111498054 [Cucurbita maxima]
MDPTPPHVEPSTDSGKAKKKSGGVMKIFKVALLMLRRRSNKSKATVDTGSDKSVWRQLVGSMRPLHVQGNESPPTISLPPLKPKKNLEELPTTCSLSPSSPSSLLSFTRTSRSSSFGTSKYASAINLQELEGRNDDDNDKNVIEDDNGGDEMIDAKAEEFITQFYEQMRRQHHND